MSSEGFFAMSFFTDISKRIESMPSISIPSLPPSPSHPILDNEGLDASSLIEQIEGGITTALGYTANGIHAGLKKRRADLSLIVSDVPAQLAAVFTTNTVKAAPILWSQAIAQGGKPVRAILINSGNANACTGATGMTHTEQMAQQAATELNCISQEVVIASTGVIGVPLPIEKILTGIPLVAQQVAQSKEASDHAAEGIMTTDTYTKQTAVQVRLGGKTVTIGGMAKGSGMIHPNMATMLGFITTDANISHEALQIALRETVEDSYHMISVDGDTSTNDMVALLANGQAGNPLIDNRNHPDYKAFRLALQVVNQALAQSIAKDGEGATKFLTVHVLSAGSKSQARALAKAIISSSLVKSAFYGADANWGRIISAMGATGVPFEPEKVSLSLVSTAGGLLMLEQGEPLPFDEERAQMILEERDIEIRVELNAGASSATAWGCDLSHEYVTINSSYRS
jgi:glutamate N-acetyltransferase/amino-acid N-acetyltransferase